VRLRASRGHDGNREQRDTGGLSQAVEGAAGFAFVEWSEETATKDAKRWAIFAPEEAFAVVPIWRLREAEWGCTLFDPLVKGGRCESDGPSLP
jgi:hypothetical protein